mgnify:CR=1 FL=1
MARNEPEKTGEEGFCICLECNSRLPRRRLITCIERNCPNCGAVMVREGSPYHLYALEQGLDFNGRLDSASRKSRKSPKKIRRSRGSLVTGHGT